jgi:hypothetical protein
MLPHAGDDGLTSCGLPREPRGDGCRSSEELRDSVSVRNSEELRYMG